MTLPMSIPVNPERGGQLRLKWTVDDAGEARRALFDRDEHGDRLVEYLPELDFTLTKQEFEDARH